jgi:hypothetical protein
MTVHTYKTGKTSENGQLSYYGTDRRLFLTVKLENDRDRLGHWSVILNLRWLNVQSNQSKLLSELCSRDIIN